MSLIIFNKYNFKNSKNLIKIGKPVILCLFFIGKPVFLRLKSIRKPERKSKNDFLSKIIEEQLKAYYNNSDAKILVINGARQIGKNFTNFRAIPKLVDENGTYKLRKGIIFSNKNITKKENNLYYYPIYQIMFI